MTQNNRGGRGRAAPPASRAVAIDPREAYASIEESIVRRQQDIVATLAKGLDPVQFMKVALQAITRTPKLLACTPASFVLALRDAAELGLMPSGLLGEGYLVPYRNDGVMQAQFQAGYLGLVKLARQSGEVLDVEARMVRERDELDIVFGTGGHVIHRPYIQGRHGTEGPGDRQGVWFRAALRSGVEHIGWMSIAEVDAIRRRSKAADSGPWVSDYEAMARKTITRAELKWLPRSTTLTLAMEREDVIEGSAEMVAETVAIQSDAQRRLLERGGIKVVGLPDDDTTPPDAPQDPEPPKADEDVTATPIEPQGQPAAGTGRCGAMHPATGLGPCVNEAGHEAAGAPHTDANGTDWT